MFGFLKRRRAGQPDCKGQSASSTAATARTEVGSPAAESQPRVRELNTLSGTRPQGTGSTDTGSGAAVSPPADHGVRYRQGDRIGGRYEVLDIFGGPGKSGMGVVYKCFDRWDPRLCALKSFQEQPVWNSRAAKTFRREAELWIALGHHPHIVPARTIRKPDGRHYLILEYIEPDDHERNCLSHFLTGRPLELEQTLTWAVQACWAMEHAARHGIRCHRDIKPDNLMIHRDGRLMVTDFGLAKAFDEVPLPSDTLAPNLPVHGLSLMATREGTACGSPPWMSPEQFGGAKDADARSDIYSFGVVLFQMLTGGVLPFRGETLKAYATMHALAPIPELASPLFPVMERCLTKQPDDRYPDFSALRRDLESHAADLAIHVPEYQELAETPERLKDWTASLTNLGRLDEAIQLADRAVTDAPDYAPAWINRSRCCLLLKQYGEALRSGLRAIELDPDSALAWTDLACAYQRKDNIPNAFAAARKAVELDPEMTGGWNTLGAIHHLCKEYRQAINCYMKVVAMDPFSFDACMNLALSYCGIKDAQQVYKWYLRAAEIDPDAPDAGRGRDEFGKALGRK